MIPMRFLPLVYKYIIRHPGRSVLTITGVATAMFLFFAVQAMRNGVETATGETAGDATLVVYRQNRFCPFASQLPENYGPQIAKVPGVRSVVPMQIVVNNCRASLDVVTFRGIPMDSFPGEFFENIRVVSGSLADWSKRSDAAMVGSRLANRRGITPGDQFNVAGITVHVAGIIDSDALQDQEVVYTHLDFIQRAAGNRQGIVTQFNVRVDNPDQMESVSLAIDDLFRDAQAPTSTWPEKAFTARAITDIIELVNFAGWLGWGSLVAVFALVANAIILSVQERLKDHAIMQALGFREELIARLIIAEAVLLSIIGGIFGLALAMIILKWSQFTFSVEGISVAIEGTFSTILFGLLLCTVVGVLAGLFPAWRASKLEIATSFRAV